MKNKDQEKSTNKNSDNKNRTEKLKKFLKEGWEWPEKREDWFISGAFGIVIIAISIPFLIMLYTGWVVNFKRFGELGPVGDFFGGTTVGLLSLASTLLVTAAIIMQKEELKLQRTELQLTRAELTKTREEHETTNKTMQIQRFETTFFNMVSLQNEIVSSLNLQNNHSGRSALKQISDNIREEIDNIASQTSDKQEIYKRTMEYYQETEEDLLGHYMRHLYRIVKFIAESEITQKEKRNYFGILRAQWSKTEFLLVYLNLFSEDGEKFKRFVKGYDVMDIEKSKEGEIIKLKESVPFNQAIRFFYEDNL